MSTERCVELPWWVLTLGWGVGNIGGMNLQQLPSFVLGIIVAWSVLCAIFVPFAIILIHSHVARWRKEAAERHKTLQAVEMHLAQLRAMWTPRV